MGTRPRLLISATNDVAALSVTTTRDPSTNTASKLLLRAVHVRRGVDVISPTPFQVNVSGYDSLVSKNCLRVDDHLNRADDRRADRWHLWHEFRYHARAALAVWLSFRAGPDAGARRGAGDVLSVAEVAVSYAARIVKSACAAGWRDSLAT